MRLELVRSVGTPAALAFQVVADVDSYRLFLPFCTESRVVRRVSPQVFEADLGIGFKHLSLSYRSRVTTKPVSEIEIESISSPAISRLASHWKFLPTDDSSTTIKFLIDVEPRSGLHARALSFLLEDVAKQQLLAFKHRCESMAGARKPSGLEISDQYGLEKLDENQRAALQGWTSQASSGWNVTSFRVVCAEMLKRPELSLSNTHLLLACSKNQTLCERVFQEYFSLRLSNPVSVLAVLLQSSELERFSYFLRLRFPQDLCSLEAMRDSTLQFEQLELDIIREALFHEVETDFALKSTNAIQSMIGMLGIVQSILNDIDDSFQHFIQEQLDKMSTENDSVKLVEWIRTFELNSRIIQQLDYTSVLTRARAAIFET
jgi:coenzyme Q-binding protein COQ10